MFSLNAREGVPYLKVGKGRTNPLLESLAAIQHVFQPHDIPVTWRSRVLPWIVSSE
jgi:hypothetical protein